jgi:hypothetical protein
MLPGRLFPGCPSVEDMRASANRRPLATLLSNLEPTPAHSSLAVETRNVVRLLRIPIGFRFEVRDFYSGVPDYNRQVDASRQNNVAFTGGLLIRF